MIHQTQGIAGMFDTLLQLRPIQILVAVLLIVLSIYLFSIGSIVVPLVFGAIGIGMLVHHWRKFQKSKRIQE